MSDLIRCSKCKGRKKVDLLGGISGKCSDCAGIGWVEAKETVPRETDPKEIKESINDGESAQKKRGRPKKG